MIVLAVTDEGFLIDNVAVHPISRGTRLGKSLLEFAEVEARRAGFDSLYLFTHEKMTENQALYGRLGYVEYAGAHRGTFLSSTCGRVLQRSRSKPFSLAPRIVTLAGRYEMDS